MLDKLQRQHGVSGLFDGLELLLELPFDPNFRYLVEQRVLLDALKLVQYEQRSNMFFFVTCLNAESPPRLQTCAYIEPTFLLSITSFCGVMANITAAHSSTDARPAANTALRHDLRATVWAGST